MWVLRLAFGDSLCLCHGAEDTGLFPPCVDKQAISELVLSDIKVVISLVVFLVFIAM